MDASFLGSTRSVRSRVDGRASSHQVGGSPGAMDDWRLTRSGSLKAGGCSFERAQVWRRWRIKAWPEGQEAPVSCSRAGTVEPGTHKRQQLHPKRHTAGENPPNSPAEASLASGGKVSVHQEVTVWMIGPHPVTTKQEISPTAAGKGRRNQSGALVLNLAIVH